MHTHGKTSASRKIRFRDGDEATASRIGRRDTEGGADGGRDGDDANVGDGEKEKKALAKALPPPAPEKTGPRGGLPSDAALEAMTGTQLRKLMARRGVGRGPQDRKEDFIDKLKAHAAGETYVNKPNPYKRAPVRKRARAPPRRSHGGPSGSNQHARSA